jgi:glycosyltransferase involved in cell wall biosynthesis
MTFLSVIIPAHNEAARLSVCLEQVIPFLNNNFIGHEIIISENGSRDDTLKIARIYANSFPDLYVINSPQRGKGSAIRRGMSFARGRWRYMCDVDLSTPIDALLNFVREAQFTHADVVIGSRELRRADVHTTLMRRVIGRAFHVMVSDLVPGVGDTQCGFKLFSDRAANMIFPRLKLSGMAMDVEALYIAQLLGLHIHEMPVMWTHNADSRVRMVQDSFEMARDVLSIPWMHTSLEQKIAA